MATVTPDTTQIRFYAADASQSRKDKIYGDVPYRLATLGGSDPRLSLFVPFTPKAELKEDDVLIMAITSVAASAFDSGSTLSIPVTIKNMTTGIVSPTFLAVKDFTDMSGTAISGTDITSAAGVVQDVIKYTVKPQERLILGHTFAENSKLYMILTTT